MIQNIDIRDYARDKNVALWRVAYKLNMHDSNFSRKLRKELSSEEKRIIYLAIDELAKGGDSDE